MKKIKNGMTFTINGDLYKIAEIKKSSATNHYELELHKSFKNPKINKYAVLVIAYSKYLQDYSMEWLGYDFGYTYELIKVVSELMEFLKELDKNMEDQNNVSI